MIQFPGAAPAFPQALRMNIFEILAEQRISEAVLRGDFDHLPGAGKPLEFEDDLFVSLRDELKRKLTVLLIQCANGHKPAPGW